MTKDSLKPVLFVIGVCLIFVGLTFLPPVQDKLSEINEEFENNVSTDETLPNCDGYDPLFGPVWLWCPQPLFGIIVLTGLIMLPLFVLSYLHSKLRGENDES